MATITLRTAVSHITAHNALLLFPVNNNPEPWSLWRCYFPRTKMRWEWTEDAQDGVPKLWHLREQLSRSRQVAYTKWYQNRATLLSLPLYTALLSCVSKNTVVEEKLGEEAADIYSVLRDDSPLPTKELRSIAGFEGGHLGRAFERGMRELWSKLLVVGFGEVEEGGFPSLAVGASRVLFEDLWDESAEANLESVEEKIQTYLGDSAFNKHFQRFKKKLEKSAGG